MSSGEASAAGPRIDTIGSAPAPRALWLPILLFLLLLALRWVLHPELDTGAWLDRAQQIEGALRAEGGSLWGRLAPVEDPRVGPTVVLLQGGCGTLCVAWLWRILAAAAGLLALWHVDRRDRPDAAFAPGAWVLACMPLWLTRCSLADPHIALGLFLLLSWQRRLPGPLALLGLSWGLGWSPWAWVVLPWALLSRPAPGAGRWRQSAGLLLPTAVAGAAVLNPPGLLDPGGWLEGMRWQAA
ncbi:MAG: hypothetical protein GF330_09345, partial [Candidatus Eisenbacteria bacterium]|nr:hypothetical protein [Candidatus Eisenbacteria bacterium]